MKFDPDKCVYIGCKKNSHVLKSDDPEEYIVTSALFSCRSLAIHFPSIGEILMTHHFQGDSYEKEIEEIAVNLQEKYPHLLHIQGNYTYFEQSPKDSDILTDILRKYFTEIVPSDKQRDRGFRSIDYLRYLFMNKLSGEIIKKFHPNSPY
jgi:hypothetical protein